jgi:acetyl-CoA synthetase
MEMESAIMECSGVAEVAVVGAPDAIKGLVPAAFVTLKAGESSSSELRDAIRRQVADVIGKIAIPEQVFFTESLPKTPSGKIMRRLLKEILEKGDIVSDTTALENRSSVDQLRAIVKGAINA